MKELPIIPIDDAFIGVCLRKLGLRPTNHKGFKSWGIKYLEQNNCVWNEVMTFHKLQPEELEQMWKAFVKRGMNHKTLCTLVKINLDKTEVCANIERNINTVL